MRRSTVLLTATIGFAVLYAAASIALGSPPEASDSGATVVSWFRDHDDNVRTWLWLLTLGAPLWAAYVAILRSVLPPVLRDVFLIGAIGFAAATAVQGWIWAGLALHPSQLRPDTARLVLDVASYWGPVLTGSVITILAPVAIAVLRAEVALPRWLGWLSFVVIVEQLVETITVFGHTGFLEPGGAMNNDLGAGLSAIALIALGITAARSPQLRAAVPEAI